MPQNACETDVWCDSCLVAADVCGHALVVIVAIVLLLAAFLTTAASLAGRERWLFGAKCYSLMLPVVAAVSND